MKLNQLIRPIFILSVLIISLSASKAHAQTPTSLNFDSDIQLLRNSAIPNFRYHYDDYLQYGPAVVMVGLKACGYESRSSWGRMLVSDAFSTGLVLAGVNGLKYSVRRLRPDNSRRNSFPSGHTATAFMSATMLHKEYGWRSPWFSIGGYTAAAVTGISRILNNRHWMTDVAAGAVLGIGATHLGYFLSDLIFKDKQTANGYVKPSFTYDARVKHYVAEVIFGHRFILGGGTLFEGEELPFRGGTAGLSADIPVIAGTGVTARVDASSLRHKSGSVSELYTVSAGGYWNLHFARILELQMKAMAGYAYMKNQAHGSSGAGIDLRAGTGLSVMIDNNFKVKAFAEVESADISRKSGWLNSVTVGWSAGWYW